MKGLEVLRSLLFYGSNSGHFGHQFYGLVCEKAREIIMKSLASFVYHLQSLKNVFCAFGQENHSLTCDTLFTLCALFPFVPVLCTWKGLILPAVGFWMRGCGRLWCCHREGHAPLLSECVMQQPLPWKTKKMFQVDVWKCYLGFVLSVGGGWWRWWLVTFTFRNIWQVLSVEQDLCEYYIKVFLCLFM